MQTQEKTLPTHIEAEQSLLGNALQFGNVVEQVADVLRPDDFYRDVHQTIYAAMLDLDRTHHTVDMITVSERLRAGGQLAEVGGMFYLTELASDKNVPYPGPVREYAQIIANCAQRRRLAFAASQIAKLAYTHADAAVAIAQSEQLLRRLALGRGTGQASDMADIGDEYITRLTQLANRCATGSITGVPAGFSELDKMTGGFQRSDLITLAARPGKGKTGLALSIARHVMQFSGEHGFKTLMFSLEMSKWQLAQRYFAMESGVDQSRLRTAHLTGDECEALIKTSDDIPRGRFWVDDESGLSVQDVRSRSRRHQGEHGLDLVIVDYMQLMKARKDDGRAYENRVEEVDRISMELKGLARELDIPVLGLAQLSRAIEQRADKIPQLSDLRESGGIEQNSDIVLFLYDDPKVVPDGSGRVVNLIVAKHRNGPVGTVQLFFQPSLTRFDNVEATIVDALPNEEEPKQLLQTKQVSRNRAWNSSRKDRES